LNKKAKHKMDIDSYGNIRGFHDLLDVYQSNSSSSSDRRRTVGNKAKREVEEAEVITPTPVVTQDRRKYKDTAAFELEDLRDCETAYRIIIFVQSHIPDVEHRAYETQYSNFIELRFENINAVDSKLLSSLMQTFDGIIWHMRVIFPDVLNVETPSLTLRIDFQKSYIDGDTPNNSTIFRDTLFTYRNVDERFTLDNLLQNANFKSALIDNGISITDFDRIDFPVLRNVVHSVYNMDQYVPIIETKLRLVKLNEQNNRTEQQQPEQLVGSGTPLLYMLHFIGINNITYEFMEYLSREKRVHSIRLVCKNRSTHFVQVLVSMAHGHSHNSMWRPEKETTTTTNQRKRIKLS
jgi:hypothetical protein